MNTFVVDASVAVKWLVNEELSEAAERLIADGGPLLAPELLYVEVANALWAAARRGNFAPAAVHDALAVFDRAPILLPSPLRALTATAVRLASDLDHPVYDCVYLALALQQGHPVITADRRFLKAVSSHHHLSALVVDLRDLALHR